MIRKLLKTFFISTVLAMGISVVTCASAMCNISLDEIDEYIHKTASVLVFTKMSSIDEKLKEVAKKISFEEEELSDDDSDEGIAEALACLIALFLPSELKEDLFTSWGCGGYRNYLFNSYQPPEVKFGYLNCWVNRKIKPDSKNENSINIYSILTRKPFEEMKELFIKDGY